MKGDAVEEEELCSVDMFVACLSAFSYRMLHWLKHH